MQGLDTSLLRRTGQLIELEPLQRDGGQFKICLATPSGAQRITPRDFPAGMAEVSEPLSAVISQRAHSGPAATRFVGHPASPAPPRLLRRDHGDQKIGYLPGQVFIDLNRALIGRRCGGAE